MAAEALKEVRSLVLPLQGLQLVLPDSVILQIIGSSEIIPIADAPSWMLGVITWQKRTIPVLSFEKAANYQYEQEQDPRILVLKSLNNIEKMPFYAITLTGIPHPIRLNAENVSVVENASNTSALILNEALVEGEPISIPNVEALEEMLFSQYGLFAQSIDDSVA